MAQKEEYWTVSTGQAVRTGWSCRECKQVIQKGENIKVRDGRKMRLFYHEACFSGDADPRSQAHSTFTEGKYDMETEAPVNKGKGKWSVSQYGYAPTVDYRKK